MAHFRAVIKGQRGEASRLGSKSSGISTLLQTWGWDVSVTARHGGGAEDDVALVELVNHQTGARIPLLDLCLSAKDYNNVVSFIYRTVDEKTSAAKLHSPERKPVIDLDQSQLLPNRFGQCSCRPGVERDNCPACEGTGQRIDFAAIRARNTNR